ncbi:hypothetical protein KKH26_00990 [Patescibacteria group bacterium]|nr:hypothetical protein [Patescibacteria group bacterium]
MFNPERGPREPEETRVELQPEEHFEKPKSDIQSESEKKLESVAEVKENAEKIKERLLGLRYEPASGQEAKRLIEIGAATKSAGGKIKDLSCF